MSVRDLSAWSRKRRLRVTLSRITGAPATRRIIAILWFSFLVLCIALPAHAQDAITISGSVKNGQSFSSRIENTGLSFRLLPSTDPNPRGWTIQIIAEDGETELSALATPPFRFTNPRYVDTGYGQSVEAAISWTPRTFFFFKDTDSARQARRIVDQLLWPAANQTPQARQNLLNEYQSLDKATGALQIVNSETRRDASNPQGWIERLDFTVDFSLQVTADP